MGPRLLVADPAGPRYKLAAGNILAKGLMVEERILVTGAPGWLGTGLVRQLVSSGRCVRCLVHPTADPSVLPSECELVRGDIRDRGQIDPAVRDVSLVYHLAAIIHAARTSRIEGINVQGTRNVVEAAARAGVRRLLLMSSNAAQGSPEGQIMNEDDPPMRPESAYGRSKYRAEMIVREYSGRIETVVIRAPMFYGPGQPPRMTKLMRMVRAGRPPVFGRGDNLRSMAFLPKVVEALILAGSTPAAAGHVYWVADEHPYTTIEVLQGIATAMDADLRIVRLPRLIARACEISDQVLERSGVHSMNLHVVGESIRWIACSVEKAKRELGYKPATNLVDGLREAVEWCRQRTLL